MDVLIRLTYNLRINDYSASKGKGVIITRVEEVKGCLLKYNC